MLEDVKVATVFLTRLPVRIDGQVSMRALADAAYAFPLVGALVGLGGGFAFWTASRLGLPSFPCAIIALAATALLTGALHEDGLADTADALGAGADRARGLEIMRDSRIGSFGAIALVLVLSGRMGALAALYEPGFVAAVLIAAASASRAAMPVVMLLQPSARAGGLAAGAGRPGGVRVLAALLLAIVLAFLLLPPLTAGTALLAGGVAALLTASALGARFGGCTGDTLGAVQQVAELAFLFAVLARQ